MERIIFGDNQFFGINHMSEELARQQTVRFRNDEAIINVINFAYDSGIRAFMCTTHTRIGNICRQLAENGDRYKGLVFYPCMPYAHKYADAVTELGMIGALRKFTPSGRLLTNVFQGGLALARKDLDSIIKMLVDAEMEMFREVKTPIIFLQNVVTDLLLGLGYHEAFEIFALHVKKKYNAEPGFITMNLPLLWSALERRGFQNPIICSNINKIGFRMCGGQDVYEELIRKRLFRPIAMSIFASGSIPPPEAIEYIKSLDGIESVLFGASTERNIRSNVEMLTNDLSIWA